MSWALKRTTQCAKCPWRKDVDPHDIPDEYSEEKHAALSCTIAEPGSLHDTGRAMACHESKPEEEMHCIGWLVNQLGPGNNIPLRMRMLGCTNRKEIRTIGKQHRKFENTLP
jgi:hypothetical protein